jgi:hypothetical protein
MKLVTLDLLRRKVCKGKVRTLFRVRTRGISKFHLFSLALKQPLSPVQVFTSALTIANKRDIKNLTKIFFQKFLRPILYFASMGKL